MAEIVILGAGLTGLSAAYHLEQNGFFDYCIFEKNSRPGGLLRSFTQDGFTFDFTGHLLHISNDYFLNFLSTVANLDNFIHQKRRSAIFSHNKLTPYPFQMNLHGLPAQVIYECINGFVNRKKSMKKPKSFYDWVLKYFGAGMGKHFFFPYQKKILCYDLKQIHPSWTGRFVPHTTAKDVIIGSVSTYNDNVAGYNSFFYYPKHGGIEFIIQQLARRLKNPITTHHKAIKIDTVEKKVFFENGHVEPFKRIITTIPLTHLVSTVNNKSRLTFEKARNKLLCNSVFNFNIGFNEKNISENQWVYFPEKKHPFYRVGFWHNINTTSVPKDCSAIYGEVAFLPSQTTNNQRSALQKKSIQQALAYLNLKESNIMTKKYLFLDHAYVIYDHWREKNLSTLLQALKKCDIYSTGRFGGWKYSSMQEAVLDGQQVARDVLTLLHKPPRSTLQEANLDWNNTNDSN